MRGRVESQALESRAQALDMVRHRRRRFERFENRNELRKGPCPGADAGEFALKHHAIALVGVLERFSDLVMPGGDALSQRSRRAVDVAGLSEQTAMGLGCDAYVRSVEKAENRFAR